MVGKSWCFRFGVYNFGPGFPGFQGSGPMLTFFELFPGAGWELEAPVEICSYGLFLGNYPWSRMNYWLVNHGASVLGPIILPRFWLKNGQIGTSLAFLPVASWGTVNVTSGFYLLLIFNYF